MRELRPPETCDSDPARSSGPTLCAQSYEWSATTKLATPCTFRAKPQVLQHTCDVTLCRDINNDCCTVPGEEAKCASSPTSEGPVIEIEERGNGMMTLAGTRFHCPRIYTCCKRVTAPAGCHPADSEALSCAPLPPPLPPRPPPSPPSPPHPPMGPPPRSPPWDFMNHERCEALFEDKRSRFHQLWSNEGWVARKPRRTLACWDGDERGGEKFFDDAWWGKDCQKRNWYTGNAAPPGDKTNAFGMGGPKGGPGNPKNPLHFSDPAPAVLGFDESIDQYCASRGGEGAHAVACVKANVNILSLYGPIIPYNTCRNIEWQICAAKGTLPGQKAVEHHGGVIQFAKAPKTLRPSGRPHPLGSCDGYAPKGCINGYASSDIFFLESCFYSMMCSNREELWNLDVGDDFVCEMDYSGFTRMRDLVLNAMPGPPSAD